MSSLLPLKVLHLGLVDYQQTFDAMRDFTANRDETTPDEIWLLQHPPIFTQGRNGRAEHLLDSGDIPLVQIDRGGQVTYHGPGQLIAYLLLDIKRRRMGVRQLVTVMEEAVIALLAEYGLSGFSRPEAPGVYVGSAKVAALGLRVTRGCSYHGLSLNVDMDLSPFERINPCGQPGMTVTDLRSLGVAEGVDQVSNRLLQQLQHSLP
jgi:lipoyl(octanoyl) transferase